MFESFLFYITFGVKKALGNCGAAGLPDADRTKCLSDAFYSGAGVTTEKLSGTISLIIITFVFLWVAWVAISQYQSFVNGEITFYDMLWRVIRSVVVLLLFTVFIGT